MKAFKTTVLAIIGARVRAIAITLSVLSLTSCTSNLPPILPGKDLKNAKYYAVKKGDTLFSISWRGELDYKTLARWNNIRAPYTIFVGQKLRLFRQKRLITRKQTTKKYNIPPSHTKRPRYKIQQQKPFKTPPKKSFKPAANIKKTTSTSWRWPIKGVISKNFSQTDNHGIEIAARRGRPVVASASGKVVYSGNGLIGYGNLIIIKHNDTYLSAYGFNKQLSANEGQWVKKGQKIAEVGSVAGNKPALHFEIRKNGKPVDPMMYLPR